ncbi:MAG: ATP-NAD kinase family protein [Paraglaciecola sp.]|nr:ATP-NAD kinase family protein [Paraglaciecola sp.]NCT47614.1 ATP-NAD kinase family protein [Paraglaciecola sp.]
MSKPLFKLGLIINPYAGIGGALALKGSDGAQIRAQALAMGASKNAPLRSQLALQEILPLKDHITFYVVAGEMGEDLVKHLGFHYTVVHRPSQQQTEALDTELAAQAMLDANVDLLLFAGGDGTARNVCSVVNEQLPVLGIPAGCKIHSGVYAITPQAAGRVLKKVISGELVSLNQAEVRDIDETLLREGRVNARQFGEMQVPTELQYIQAVKMGGRESDELVLADIAAHVIELMDHFPDHYFVMGSGSTVDFVMQELGLNNTLLGVDVVLAGRLVASDVTANELLSLTADKPCKVVLTLIGGQGHILGRGNQQLSPAFISRIGKENMLVIASKTKLASLNGRPLISDSGDSQLDEQLAGRMAIITGYHDQVLYPLADFRQMDGASKHER